jgi:hypothetical protein
VPATSLGPSGNRKCERGDPLKIAPWRQQSVGRTLLSAYPSTVVPIQSGSSAPHVLAIWVPWNGPPLIGPSGDPFIVSEAIPGRTRLDDGFVLTGR